MAIQIKKFSFVSAYDRVPVHGTCMIPEHPVGILQMVHGMCEHEERYHNFMRDMAGRGYVALMHDNRGHGKSVASQWDIGYSYPAGAKGFVADIYFVAERIRRQFPGLPLILYGHSMGSLGVRAFLARHDDMIDGLVISGNPGYYGVTPLARRLLRLLIKWKGDRYRSPFLQGVGLNAFGWRFRKEGRQYPWIAADPEVEEEFIKDIRCNFTYTLNGLLTLMDLSVMVYQSGGYQVKNPDLPILFVSGEDDPCYINEKKWRQAIERMHAIGYEQTTAIRFPGMRHEIHNEVLRKRVFDEMDGFFQDYILHFEGN